MVKLNILERALAPIIIPIVTNNSLAESTGSVMEKSPITIDTKPIYILTGLTFLGIVGYYLSELRAKKKEKEYIDK